ncbi:hypothetical protein HPP92_016859 [Vanilla planifolia]|uniref:Uncharacterized protein n=1 Tax=Vanilla planifolia TaxID=51239 RepID=A0A835QIC5_VANPL|nr:hypothetical protein HPP92_016859 [Vanilla planifolia]
MAIDPETKELLYYEDKLDFSQQHVSLDKMLLADNASLYLHNDKQSFTDNFDCSISHHFVEKGLLVDDIKLDRQGIYTPEVILSRSARIDLFTLIGYATTVGDGTVISNSVIGQGVHLIAGSVLQPGVILSFKVEVGQKTVVPAYAKVSHLPQPCKQDKDEGIFYANSGVVQSPKRMSIFQLMEIYYDSESTGFGMEKIIGTLLTLIKRWKLFSTSCWCKQDNTILEISPELKCKFRLVVYFAWHVQCAHQYSGHVLELKLNLQPFVPRNKKLIA